MTQKLSANQIKLISKVSRDCFEDFSREFWSCIPGVGDDLHWNWHMTYICNEMQIAAERVFQGLPREEDILINISPGSSKPVWEEMNVLMASGEEKLLKDIKPGDVVIGKSGKPCRVMAVHKQGELPCVRITTAAGREITAAVDHPILTANGWINAGDIRPEHMLALMHRPQTTPTTDRTEDEFRLAGYFIGDGSCTGGNCSLTSKDPEYIDDFKSCAKRMGFDCSVVTTKTGVTIIRPIAKKLNWKEYKCPECGNTFSPPSRSAARCCSMSCGARWLASYNKGERKWVPRVYRSKQDKHNCRQWLRDVGIWNKSSKTKEIPEFVWKGTDKQIAAFLAAYFHCDGHVSWKDNNKRNVTVSMCSVSHKLAKGLQSLFLRLGISLRFRKHVAKNGFVYNRGLRNYTYYTVSTSDQDSASRFMEVIPLIGRKKDKLKEFFPHRRTFEQAYWPDKVVSVNSVGSLPCRCLSVAHDKSFVVDGVVVHNSSLCSVLFPAWVWTRMPHARILSSSHTDALVLDLSNKSRSVIRSEKYKQCFPEIELSDVQDAKGYYTNTHGGYRFTCTVAGKSPMGFHAHFLIGDDLIDPKKAVSEAETRAAREFVTNVFPTRKVDKSISVTFYIMQRLSVDDPTSVVLEEADKEGAAKVKHICLPAELVEGNDGKFSSEGVKPPHLAAKYKNGLMDPKRMPKSVLKEFRARGSHFYETQFQQRPFSQEGGLFKIHYFSKIRKTAPYDCVRVRYYDRASATGESACYTAGVLLAKDKEGSYYVEHVIHGRYEPTERNKMMRGWAIRDRRKYGPNHEPVIYTETEGGSSGVDAHLGVARALEGFVVRGDRPSGSKDVRAEPWASQLEAGNVFIVDDGTWDVDAYIREHLAFKPDPSIKRLGKFKDQVDASSAAFSLLSGMKKAGTLRTYNLDRKKKGVVRILVCTPAELQELVVENHSILCNIQDPVGDSQNPEHGLEKLLDQISTRFANVDPREHQETWGNAIVPYGKTCEELMLTQEEGKRFWAFLLKRRDPYPGVIVLCDEDLQRSITVACAISDVLGFSRNKSIWVPSSVDVNYEGVKVNQHVYDMLKRCRGMVMA